MSGCVCVLCVCVTLDVRQYPGTIILYCEMFMVFSSFLLPISYFYV